jgi:hypothetical protein
MVACHCDRRCDRYHCVFVCGRDSGGTQTPEPIELPRPTFHGYAWEGLPPAVGAVRADHDSRGDRNHDPEYSGHSLQNGFFDARRTPWRIHLQNA